MKVAIIGSHKVGKTYLVKDIVASLGSVSKVKYVPELAREVLDWLQFDWRQLSKDLYTLWEVILFNYYSLAERLPGSYVSDRSTLDVAAYMALKMPQPEVETFSVLAWASVKMFVDRVYFYRGNDGTKEGEFVENKLLELLTAYNIQYTEFWRKDYNKIKAEIISLFYQEAAKSGDYVSHVKKELEEV